MYVESETSRRDISVAKMQSPWLDLFVKYHFSCLEFNETLIIHLIIQQN